MFNVFFIGMLFSMLFMLGSTILEWSFIEVKNNLIRRAAVIIALPSVLMFATVSTVVIWMYAELSSDPQGERQLKDARLSWETFWVDLVDLWDAADV